MFFFSIRSRYTRCAVVTGVQSCALPIFRRFSGDFAFDRGQRAKVEPARVFALVIAVEHGERDAIGPSPIAVPQRDDAGPRRRFEHQRGTIARNRARMAFAPEAVIGKATPAETIDRNEIGRTTCWERVWQYV